MTEAMKYISLAEFQRNAIRTSLKKETPPNLDDFSVAYLKELTKSQFPKELHYLEDLWKCGTIATVDCYIAHPDFRCLSINKDRRYADEFPKWRTKISSTPSSKRLLSANTLSIRLTSSTTFSTLRSPNNL